MVVEAVLVLVLTRMGGKPGGRAAGGDEAGRRTRRRVSQAELVAENNLGEDELCPIRILTCKSCCVGLGQERQESAMDVR